MKVAFKIGLIVALCMLLWPGLAGAAPPAPQGKLVYEDDFNDPKKSGLENNLTATDYSRGFHAPGVYHLKDIKNGETQWELFPNQSYGDFTFQADVWDNSDDVTAGDIAEGLAFRAKDDTHFYTVLVDPRKGNYAVRKLDGKDTWSDLVAWTVSPLVKRKSDVNQLRVDGAGSKFTIYLNGEMLTSFSDSAYTKGQIGFIASNVDASSNHIHFDNPKVWTTEAAGPKPAGLPNTGQDGDGAPLLMLALALSLLSLGVWLRRRTISIH
jgi:LPXTG-motif cell wall-anchored protein